MLSNSAINSSNNNNNKHTSNEIRIWTVPKALRKYNVRFSLHLSPSCALHLRALFTLFMLNEIAVSMKSREFHWWHIFHRSTFKKQEKKIISRCLPNSNYALYLFYFGVYVFFCSFLFVTLVLIKYRMKATKYMLLMYLPTLHHLHRHNA